MRRLIGWIFMLGVIVAGELRADETSPLVVILMGPPGSGKGTHALPLSERLQIPHISTGDLFRDNIRKETPLGKLAKSYMNQGNLVPDEVVLGMLFARIEQPDCKKGYILDGFPRTIAQAKALDEKIRKTCQLAVVNLQISDSLLIERISGRVSCKSCARCFHTKYNPPKNPSKCDSCEGTLYQRDDDKAEVLTKRLEVYHEQTGPLVAYYQKTSGVLREVDASQPKEIVLQAVVEAANVGTLALN